MDRRLVNTDQALIDAIKHLRELYRCESRNAESNYAVHSAREAFCTDLISNARKGASHPTPRILFKFSQYFGVTIESAYRLFGYDLPRLRTFDGQINGDHTRFIDTYGDVNDCRVQVPAQLAGPAALQRNALLKDLVSAWQECDTIRCVAGKGWHTNGILYAQTSKTKSGSYGPPPGAFIAVEPTSKTERHKPDSYAFYLLQFANGYGCFRCEARQDGRLSLIVHGSAYRGQVVFRYPGEIKIIGRIKMSAFALPTNQTAGTPFLPKPATQTLVAPWSHASLASLFAAQADMLDRSPEEWDHVRGVVESITGTKLSARTLRRYRRDTHSIPHTSALLALSLAYGTRFSDLLRVLKYSASGSHVHTVEELLKVNSLDRLVPSQAAAVPKPESLWATLTQQWGGWPSLLSAQMPNLQARQNEILRLNQSTTFAGLDSILPAGSIAVLKQVVGEPASNEDVNKRDWARPIYALHRRHDIVCGYLECEAKDFILVPHSRGRGGPLRVPRREVKMLSRVTAVAVPH